jgi:hypothetical protein
MIEYVKPVEALTVVDLKVAPIWEYTNRDGPGETMVRAVNEFPVRNLSDKLIGAPVRLANGTEMWALIGNVDSRNTRLTEHSLTLSIERGGEWFFLARYHDFDYARRGPDALSQFLGLTVDEIFPISFDLRRYAEGDESALRATVEKEPREKLTRAEIIAMAVP